MIEHGYKKTAVLGTVVVMMILSIFVALPVNVPSLKSMDGEAVFWGCTSMGVPPDNWDTWTWYSADPPNMYDWVMLLLQSNEQKHYGILENLRSVPSMDGAGSLDIDFEPETDGDVTISGFLQFGVYPDAEDATPLDSIHDSENSTKEYIIPLETLIQMPGMMELLKMKLKDLPLPQFHGTLKGRDVNVSVKCFQPDGSSTVEKTIVRTDIDGYFKATVKPDPDTVYLTIVVTVGSEVIIPKQISKPWHQPGKSLPQVNTDVTVAKMPVQFYFPAVTRYTNYENKYNGFIFDRSNMWWLLPVIFAGGIILVYFMFVRKKVVFSSVTGIEELTVDHAPVMQKEQRQVFGGDVDQLRIEFPGIEADLPSVWGVRDSLDVVVSLTKRDCELLEIDWKDGTTENITPDQSLRISVIHTFAKKGEYAVSAGYTKPSKEQYSVWRIVNIVDYREEMVRLFSYLLDALDLEPIPIEREMTPREVERLIVTMSASIPRDKLSVVINGFEEANYSTHPIDRPTYLKMYQAIQVVERAIERKLS